MRYINDFTIGECCSQDHGVILTAPPKETFAERDVDFISIPGRSGDLTVNNGRFKNVPLTFDCALVEPFSAGTMRTAAEEFVGYLKQFTSYSRLEDSYHPDSFRMAMLVSSVDVESIVEQTGFFSLQFTCKPQRYLRSGENSVTLTASGSLRNPTYQPSKPLITIYGSAPGNLTVGAVTAQIKKLSDKITLDCETMNAYRQVGDAAPENKNGDIYAMEFPELLPGDNAVSWTGGITRVEIIPRWWTL